MLRENTPSDAKVNFGFIILISSVAALGGFLFGYDSGCINGAIDALQVAFNASNLGSGFNVASMLLGCAVGAFMAGGLADKFGRRPTLFVSAILFGISAFGSGIAGGSLVFIMFRLIGGFAVGAASIISPAYISEIAPAAYRGRLSSLQQLAIVLGLFLAFLSNYLIAAAAGGASETFWLGYEAWRWMFWVELIPVALFGLGLFLIPESPRYLVAVGRKEEAQVILGKISHPDDAANKVASIQKTVSSERKPKLSDIFKDGTKKLHPIVWVGLAIAALQQLVGINVVFYYGAVLWKTAGFSEADALKINVIGGIINVVSTVVAIALVDKWGRKPLLLTGSAGMAIFLGVLAVIFGTANVDAAGDLQLSGSAGTVALICANCYIIMFGISWGPVMWVMLGEMFPNRIRGAALAVAGLSQWITNFAVTMTFPILLASIGLGGAYGLYAGFALISFFIVKAIVRETKGRTLEDMQAD
ncbi:sugar porter family MFS transporter [Cerasicoccus arenae]|uniref:MFS transporter n=2 Tax=Cerasicoccus arenae TaxID=424488 RepID=A0A8J3DC22_9BACT|nr:sugar porter family MFS transporter [Cerasicoccus arenae]MBK1857390.1 sugar porter family MFS transporter [Cerasicoccus arenae]GHC07988.1 MFS transporter [Cerasicoccus arenae]